MSFLLSFGIRLDIAEWSGACAAQVKRRLKGCHTREKRKLASIVKRKRKKIRLKKEKERRKERRKRKRVAGERRLPALLTHTHTHIATRLLSDADWFRLW